MIAPAFAASVLAVAAAIVAVTAVLVIRVVRHDARVNAALDAEHEARVRRWVDAARSGRGDPPPQQGPRALPSGPAPAVGTSRGSGVSS